MIEQHHEYVVLQSRFDIYNEGSGVKKERVLVIILQALGGRVTFAVENVFIRYIPWSSSRPSPLKG